ncbi:MULTISPECIES: polymer-forming cytoskeletal protein [unclassified Thioalkalivibrio]|uniref:bactofilin family protein n=1 Tax=unclassified Thioalkalivibrio TaxID=2621013 RepID=UPI00036C4F66|nr:MULTISPECIES: polymer-forming cytoskeletal protein [unclassified Thioalkalivibrio]
MMGRKKGRRAGKVDTLVGRNTVIHGDVEFGGGLHIEGRVIGDIRATTDPSAVLVVADGGVIEGHIAVPHLLMNGEVQGDVHVGEHVELGETARLVGNLYYTMLQMAEGAQIDGLLKRVDHPLQGELEGPGETQALTNPTEGGHS